MTSIAAARNSITSIIAGSALIAVARGISQVVQIVIFVIAARVLEPAAFGVYAFVSAVAMLGAVVAQGGWPGFILSSRDDADAVEATRTAGATGTDATRQALSLSVLSGFGMATVGIAASALVPPGAVDVARDLAELFAAWIFVATCAEGQFAALLRQGRAAAAAVCQIVAEFAGLAVTLWLLHLGLGAAALVWGRIAAQGVQLAGTLALSRTLPALRLTRPVVGRAAAYSASLVSVRVVGNLRSAMGTFVVGGFLGAEAVGFFRLAQRLVGAVYEIVCEPARVAAWMVFRRALAPFAAATDPQAQAALQHAMERFVPLLFSIAAPIFVGLSLVADDMLALLLGEAWRPAGPIASILAIASLLTVATSLSEPLLSLTGKIRYLPRVSLAYAAVSLCIVVPCGFLGLYAITWAHLALGAVGFAMMLWVQERALGLDWWRIGAKCLFLVPLLAAMAGALVLLRHLVTSQSLDPPFAFALTAVPAAGLYLAVLAAVRGRVLGFAMRAPRQP